MKNHCQITLQLSEDMMKKFLFICQAENRTPQNQFNFMLRNNLSYYEKTKGRINEQALREVDIAPYRKEE